MTTNPVTIGEIFERGMDDRLTKIIQSLIGEQILGTIAYDEINPTPNELAALGYGKPCECGERALHLDEEFCAACMYS